MLRIILISTFYLVTTLASSQCNEIYRMEGDNLYFGQQKIDVTPGIFRIHLNPHYLTRWDNPNELKYSEKKWVIYCCGRELSDPFGQGAVKLQLPSIKNEYDPVREKFEVIGPSHAKDQRSIYFRSSVDVGSPHGPKNYAVRFLKMDSVDYQTFELIQNSDIYSRDKDHVFYCNVILKGADPNSFTILGGDELQMKLVSRFNFAQDKNHVYRELYILKDIKPEDFKLLDQTHCLWKGMKYEILNSAQTKLVPVND